MSKVWKVLRVWVSLAPYSSAGRAWGSFFPGLLGINECLDLFLAQISGYETNGFTRLHLMLYKVLRSYCVIQPLLKLLRLHLFLGKVDYILDSIKADSKAFRFQTQ
jgi:hypothetical protein